MVDTAIEEPRKNTLVVVGNGFDLWQGIRSTYSDFHDYYLEHRECIKKRLHVKDHHLIERDESGEIIADYRLGDVEMIYGDPFEPSELDTDFWSSFETSLGLLDSQRLNLYFGKEKRDLREMRKCIRRAQKVLRKTFCEWVKAMDIEPCVPSRTFSENCVFVNFNYTDTLIRRFGVAPENVFHIHGEASDEESIVFGHSSHPQTPEPFLYKCGGRFHGLYLVEETLYETDKHVLDNIRALSLYMALSGIYAEDIEHVYVLGHSMGLPDLGYFQFLLDATIVRDDCETDGGADEGSGDPLEELYCRMEYAVKRYGHDGIDEEITDDERAAMLRRFEEEQAGVDEQVERMVFGGKKRIRTNSPEESKIACRIRSADWHITCYRDVDCENAEQVMSSLGCEDYRLYPTIEECIDELLG